MLCFACVSKVGFLLSKGMYVFDDVYIHKIQSSFLDVQYYPHIIAVVSSCKKKCRAKKERRFVQQLVVVVVFSLLIPEGFFVVCFPL